MKRILSAATLLALLSVAALRAQTFDALAELQKANHQTLPDVARNIEETTDARIIIEVDPKSFGDDEKAWNNLVIIANRVAVAFDSVGRDQVGKDAIARDVKRVIILKLPADATDSVEVKDQTVYVRTTASDKAMTTLHNVIEVALEKALATGHPPPP